MSNSDDKNYLVELILAGAHCYSCGVGAYGQYPTGTQHSFYCELLEKRTGNARPEPEENVCIEWVKAPWEDKNWKPW